VLAGRVETSGRLSADFVKAVNALSLARGIPFTHGMGEGVGTTDVVRFVRKLQSFKQRREVAALLLRVKDGVRYHGRLGVQFAK
jgi:hypothetical protein